MILFTLDSDNCVVLGCVFWIVGVLVLVKYHKVPVKGMDLLE